LLRESSIPFNQSHFQILDMKIYIQDLGVYGSIVVIAENEESARKMMVGNYNYESNTPLLEHEIKPGFVFCNLGDC
jgi:hypothetical protein